MSRLSPPGWLAGIAIAATVLVGLFVVPADAGQGDVQRIMYVHVPSAWLAYAAFFVTLLGSILYLARRDLRFDRVAAASAEVGLVFTGLTIISMIGLLFTGAYILKGIRAVLHGPFNMHWKDYNLEIELREVVAIAPLLVLMLVTGILPNWILTVINSSVTRLFGG